MRRPVEEVEAHRIADGPVVEVAAPAIHLRRRDACRIVDERRQQSRFVPPGRPERRREIVIAAETLGQLLDVRHRDAKGLRRRYPEAGRVVAVLGGTLVLEGGQRGLDLSSDRVV